MELNLEFNDIVESLLQQITALSKENALLKAESIALKRELEALHSEKKSE